MVGKVPKQLKRKIFTRILRYFITRWSPLSKFMEKTYNPTILRGFLDLPPPISTNISIWLPKVII